MLEPSTGEVTRMAAWTAKLVDAAGILQLHRATLMLSSQRRHRHQQPRIAVPDDPRARTMLLVLDCMATSSHGGTPQ